MSIPNLKVKPDSEDASKSGAYIQQAQNLWSMLDDMASNDPKAYKSFIEKTLKEGKEMMKQPEPNMCVIVTVTAPKKYKLYINFFEWIRITAPKSDEDPIPVYGQKIETFKNNESIVNIAFSPEILKKYGKNAANLEEREMLINLAIQYIEEQNNVSIDSDSIKVLNDTICFGDKEANASRLTNQHAKSLSDRYEFNAANDAFKAMQSNQMPDEKTILDNLLKLNINPNSSKQQESVNGQNQPKVSLIEELNPEYEIPKYKIEVIEKMIDGNHDSIVQIKIQLDKISSMKECDLSIDEAKNTINLVANKAFYKPLEISLNEYKSKYNFSLEQLDAKFIKKNSILKLTINAKKI